MNSAVQQILIVFTCLAPTALTVASPIVASVNDQPIHADEVLYFLPRSVGTRPSDKVWKVATELAVDRRLVLAALSRQKKVVSEASLDAEIARLERGFSEQGTSLAERLERGGTSTVSFRHVLRWQLTWKKYLNATLTDENLQRYFRSHKRDFDGTKIRAAHILLPRGADESDKTNRLMKANRVLAEIRSGGKSFDAAAAAYSTAPSAKSGGDVGWIERHQPMSPEFSEAAFRLNPGDVSQPVVSSVGIHLIRCTDIKPGDGTWVESREQLIEAVRRYLFKWLADQERPRAKISTSELSSETLNREQP